MTIKTFAIAAAATFALASSAAAANSFPYAESDVDSSTVELGLVSTKGNGIVEIYDFNTGAQGALLGSEALNAGANYDVRVNLGKKPINDVLAVLSVDGQIVDTLEIDLER